MKYTKTVPYFKKGDKIDKAAKNLPKKQKEAVLKVSSAQKEQERKDKLSSVGANFKKPTAKVEGPKTSQASKIKPIEKKPVKPVAKTRDEAFAQARKANKKEFIWEGNPYHTRTAEEMAAGTSLPSNTTTNAAVVDPTTSVEQTSTTESTNGGSSSGWDGTLIPKEEVARRSRLRAFGTEDRPAEEAVSVTNVNTTAPARTVDNSGNWLQRGFLPSLWDWMKYHNTVQQNSVRNAQDRATIINAQKKKDTAERKAAAEDARKKYWEARGYQQGGNINKLQRGNSIKNTDYSAGWEERKRKREYRAWKNSDAATQRLNTLFDNTKRPLSVSTSNTDTGELVKIRPHWIDRFAGNSNTIVRQVSPNLQDTTYVVDDGVRRYANYQDGSYRETMPIIGPGRYTGSTPPTREALQNQFEQYYKKNGGTINKSQRRDGWLFQQGGQMPQEGSQEELVLDFAVRYLVTMGVPEEDIMDPQGNLNPEHQQELEQVFNSQEIAWSDYAASPDEYMQQFIGNLQAQTQMARKGAKLKRLGQLRIYKK